MFPSVYIVQYNINWCKQVKPKLSWKKWGKLIRTKRLGKIWGPVPPLARRRTATGTQYLTKLDRIRHKIGVSWVRETWSPILQPLVGGQGAKPPEAKSIFIFLASWGSGKIMALGARAPCAPRGSANGCSDVQCKKSTTNWNKWSLVFTVQRVSRKNWSLVSHKKTVSCRN